MAYEKLIVNKAHLNKRFVDSYNVEGDAVSGTGVAKNTRLAALDNAGLVKLTPSCESRKAAQMGGLSCWLRGGRA